MKNKIPKWGVLALLGAGAVLLAPIPFGVTVIRSAITIAAPAPQIYRYVTTPDNWPRWHPSSLAVAGDTGHSLLVGEQVSEDFVVAGYQGKVLWTVVQRQAPLAWSIAGKIDHGGSGKVSYRLTEIDGGTRFERTFEYTRPNLLFALADRLHLRARVDAESAEALRRLKAALEGEGAGAATKLALALSRDWQARYA